MKVFLEKENKISELKFSGKAQDLLKKLEVNSESVIIVRNGDVISEDALLRDTDSIDILSVVSGG